MKRWPHQTARPWRVRVAAAAGVSALLLGATTAVHLADNQFEVPRLEWRDCPDNSALECASYEVPLDHADPGGERVTLALVKAPAEHQKQKLGSLVVNRGGPGFSTVEYLQAIKKGLVAAPVDQRVWDRYDVIGLDQRGVGEAWPLATCFESPAEQSAFNDGVSAFPRTLEDARIRATRDEEFAELCRMRSGSLLDHMSTAIVARDLDLVRQALSEQRLNFLGQSYGVHLGLAYANLFPQHVGSLVLDSVLNPAATLSGRPGTVMSERTGADVETQRLLAEFLRLCAEGQSCSFATHGPHRALDELLAKLEANPLPLRTEGGAVVTLTYPKLIAFAGGLLYQPAAWTMLADLFDMTYRVQQAQANPNAAALAKTVQFIDQNGFDSPYSDFKGAYAAFTCSDLELPDKAAVWWLAAERRASVASRFAALRAYDSSACARWQATPAERYTGPWSVRTDTSVLILTNRFDPATPAAGATELQRLLPNSRLLVNEGWGHISTQQSECMIDAASAYLATAALPAPGASCEPDFTPFAEPA